MIKYKVVIFITYFLTIHLYNVSGYSGRTTVLNGQLYQWTHGTKIKKLEVNWIDSHPEYVTIEMKGPTKGYISIGFSPSGGMAGADIILGWVTSNGTAKILDMYATHNGRPVLDKKTNVELLGGVENESGTSIVFRRKWNTCDDEDFPLGDDTIRMIWAISESDPVENEISSFTPMYHGRNVNKRGVKSIFMKVLPNHRKFPDEEDIYPEDVKHIDLILNNVSVPKTETHYHCKILKLPNLGSNKKQFIAYRPLIAPESYPYVHHIAVFRCHVPEILGLSNADVFEKYLNHPGGDCYTDAAPKDWSEYCFEFMIAIGAGSEGDVYPAHLGDPIEDTNGPVYYRLEVHYENPNGAHLIDSSGVRMFYTSTLREYEIGMLFAGHRRTPFLTIPPHQKEYNIYGFCIAECTTQGIPKDGIKIISVLLHAHLTGRKIILRHIRDGKELPPIAQDNHYDFNYQHFRLLREERVVLPGDELITECTYDTEKNDTFVYGGLSTRREMCESFIAYYPKSVLSDCRSQPEFYSYFKSVGVENASGKLLDMLHLPFSSKDIPEAEKNSAVADDSMVVENGQMNELIHDIFRNTTITSPKNLKGQDLHEYFSSLNWQDKQFAESVEQNRKLGKHYVHCSAPGGIKIHTLRDSYPFPTFEPYQSEGKSCLSSTSSGSKQTITATTGLTLVLLVSCLFY